jgi:hypothetical protein
MTREEEDKIYRHFVEDYCRRLDASGWMIVPQPDMAQYGPWKNGFEVRTGACVG